MLYRSLVPQVQGTGTYSGGSISSDIVYDFSRKSGMIIVDSPVYNTVGGPLIPSTYYRTNTVLTYFYSIAVTEPVLSPYYYHYKPNTSQFNYMTSPTDWTYAINTGASSKVSGGKIDNSGINCVITANTGISVGSFTTTTNTTHNVATGPANKVNPISFTTDDVYFAGSTTDSTIYVCKITPQVSPYITHIYTSAAIGGTITDMAWMGDDLIVFSQINATTPANVVVFTLNRTNNSVSIKVPNTSMVAPYPVYVPQVMKIDDSRFLLSSAYISGEINLMDFTYNSIGTFTSNSVGGSVANNTTGGVAALATNYPYIAYPCLNRLACVVKRPSSYPVVFEYISATNSFSRAATKYNAFDTGKIFAHDSGKIFSRGGFFSLS